MLGMPWILKYCEKINNFLRFLYKDIFEIFWASKGFQFDNFWKYKMLLLDFQKKIVLCVLKAMYLGDLSQFYFPFPNNCSSSINQ